MTARVAWVVDGDMIHGELRSNGEEETEVKFGARLGLGPTSMATVEEQDTEVDSGVGDQRTHLDTLIGDESGGRRSIFSLFLGSAAEWGASALVGRRHGT